MTPAMKKKTAARLKRVKSLLLVSSSPRRKELLERFVPKLLVAEPKCRERVVRSRADLAANARAKLGSVCSTGMDLALAADTAVFLDKKALGKPGSRESAMKMLAKLSGRWHAVVTAIAIEMDGEAGAAVVSTRVKFRELSTDAIEAYVASGEPLDKAGAYGIQGLGGLLVEEIKGDYYNVVGLPIQRLEEMLEARGYTLFSAPA